MARIPLPSSPLNEVYLNINSGNAGAWTAWLIGSPLKLIMSVITKTRCSARNPVCDLISKLSIQSPPAPPGRDGETKVRPPAITCALAVCFPTPHRCHATVESYTWVHVFAFSQTISRLTYVHGLALSFQASRDRGSNQCVGAIMSPWNSSISPIGSAETSCGFTADDPSLAVYVACPLSIGRLRQLLSLDQLGAGKLKSQRPFKARQWK